MANPLAVQVPDIGDFDAVEIIEVVVAPGQSVAAEDPLITLESDKATMEIPAPMAGVVVKVLVAVGEMVSQGMEIVLLDSGDGGESGDGGGADSAAAGDSADKTKAESAGHSASQPKSADKSPKSATESAQNAASAADSKPEATPQPEATPASNPLADSAALPHASPAIRRLARELGADLSAMTGHGDKGRILESDVKAWVKSQLTAAGASGGVSGGGIPAIPAIDFSQFGEVETLPLSRIKKLSGPHLQRAWLNIPHVTHHDLADITELEAFRQALKGEAEKAGIRITLLAFVLKILAQGLRKFPNFNASLHPDGGSLLLKKYYNIGLAVDTPGGLVVPVIRGVDSKSITDLAREMGELSQRARDGKLKSADLQGGCISISSLGGIGGVGFTPIVNAPEVAILGLTRARITPLWDGEKFQPRLLLPLDLSYDHRAIDGAEAARFVTFLCQSLADVRRLML